MPQDGLGIPYSMYNCFTFIVPGTHHDLEQDKNNY